MGIWPHRRPQLAVTNNCNIQWLQSASATARCRRSWRKATVDSPTVVLRGFGRQSALLYGSGRAVNIKLAFYTYTCNIGFPPDCYCHWSHLVLVSSILFCCGTILYTCYGVFVFHLLDIYRLLSLSLNRVIFSSAVAFVLLLLVCDFSFHII